MTIDIRPAAPAARGTSFAHRQDATSDGLLAFLLLLLIAFVYAGVWTLFPNMTAGSAGNDALFLADGARRIAAGQIPHVDFFLPTGALPFYAYYLSERFLPLIPPFIGSGLLGFLLLAPFTALVCAQLPNRPARLALIAIVAMATLLPYNTNANDICGTAFYASYNRFCTALTAVYLAWFFRASPSRVLLNSAVVMAMLTVVIFSKFVFLGVLLGPLVIYALFDSRWRNVLLIGCAGAILVLVAAESSTGLLRGYLADIQAMSAINRGRVPYFLASFVYKFFFELLLFAAVILALSIERLKLAAGIRGSWFERLSVLAQPAAMLAALAGIMIAESQSTGGLHMVGALGLLFAPGLVGSAATPRIVLFTAAATLVGGGLVINSFQKGVCNLVNRRGAPTHLAWTDPFMAHVVVPETMSKLALARVALWTDGASTMKTLEAKGHSLLDTSAPDLYLAQWKSVDDALQVLKSRGIADLGRVTTLSFVDLFGIALKAAPPKGVKTVLDVGRTVSPMSSDEVRAYLRNVDTVFVPTCSLNDTPGPEAAAPWFRDELKTGFTADVLTPCWTMYRRKT